MKTDSEHDLSGFPPSVLIINSAHKWVGEAEHSMNLVQGLRSRGIDAILVCRRNFPLEDYAKKNNIPHYAIKMNTNFNGIHDLLDFLKLRSIIKKHNISVIHCHRGKDHWLSACTRLFIPREKRPALIRTRHVTVPVKKHIFNKWLYKNATDAVIAVSKKSASSLDGLPLPAPPAIIYAAVDSRRFSPDKRSEQMRRQCGIPQTDPQAPLIGLVGRLQRIKGQHIFIQSIKKILGVFPNARFVIAGKGSERKYLPLIKLAKEKGVFGHIYTPGFMDNIEELIASLDVGVIASLGSEGSSRICMEYMASRIPIVATSVGGIPELLEEGNLGALINPGNPDDLASVVIEILSNKTPAREKVENAHKKALEFLNLDRFIDETLAIYRKYSFPPPEFY
ncbi:glycosyltransferase family 4 protein [Candidatus Sumerlaeota bacterium]|nr:glycosyltransferase family 4 protein [Candidatus Sumerlaeota bacterium]